jgi:hypothetical protein
MQYRFVFIRSIHRSINRINNNINKHHLNSLSCGFPTCPQDSFCLSLCPQGLAFTQRLRLLLTNSKIMTKIVYIPWSPAEEENLSQWVADRLHLSWEEIAEEYFRNFGIPRSINSLRGKLAQLERGIVRRRPTSVRAPRFPRTAASRSRRRGHRLIDHLRMVPPVFVIKKPDPQIQQLLHQMRRLEISHITYLDESSATTESPSPLQPELFISSGESKVPTSTALAGR